MSKGHLFDHSYIYFAREMSKKRKTGDAGDDITPSKDIVSSKKGVKPESASPDESGSESLDDEVGLAVEHATNIIASMPSLEVVQDVLQEVKSRIRCLLYSGEVGLLFKEVMMCDDKINPFTKQERTHLNTVFNKCSVDSHETFKDNECTLTTRKEICGASTTFVCHGRDGGARMFTMTWYWRPDEELGFIEEFSLVYKCEEEDTYSDSNMMDEETILDGTRSLKCGVEADVRVSVLQTILSHLACKISAQALLRFLILCCRTECPKCQDRINSVTHGFSRQEDAEDVCRFLSSFVVDGAADCPPSKAAAAARGRPPRKAAAKRGGEDATPRKRRR